jgi:hypothetical protein
MNKIRFTGIGTFLVLALLAIPAFASASTGGFVSETYPVTYQATNTGTHTFSTTVPIECTSSTFQAEAEKASETLTAAPSYGGCAYGKNSVSVNMNGCSLTFGVNETGSQGTMSIGPAGCGPIKITGLGCEQKIGSQSNLSGVTYSNSGSGSSEKVNITANVSVAYTSTGFGCGNGSGSGTYSGSWEVSGKSKYGSAVGVHTTGSLPVPIYLNGEGESPHLDAEQFPVTLTSVQDPSHKDTFTTGAGILDCTQGTLSGSASAATSTIELTPSYSGCVLRTIFGNISVTIATNGCKYTYGIEGSSSFHGTAQLVCPEGKSLVASGPGCAVTWPAQELGSVTYPIAAGGAIEFVVSGSKMKYSYKGFTCGSASGESGSFSQDRILRGSR